MGWPWLWNEQWRKGWLFIITFYLHVWLLKQIYMYKRIEGMVILPVNNALKSRIKSGSMVQLNLLHRGVASKEIVNELIIINLSFQHYKDRLQAQGVYLDFLDEPAESIRRRREGTYVSYSFGTGDKSIKVRITFLWYPVKPFLTDWHVFV